METKKTFFDKDDDFLEDVLDKENRVKKIKILNNLIFTRFGRKNYYLISRVSNSMLRKMIKNFKGHLWYRDFKRKRSSLELLTEETLTQLDFITDHLISDRVYMNIYIESHEALIYVLKQLLLKKK